MTDAALSDEPRASSPWTPEDIALLRRMLVVRHCSRRTVAVALGRSINSVTTKACELGLRKRAPGRAARTDDQTNQNDFVTFRRECEEANERYIKAVDAAGGGSWSGHVTPNSSGSAR